ncbi:Methyl-accepting chemotaxis protein [Desulfonatronum zhilinae]|nr:Methyl-accepting chemotaxis protein [Desulfonatronum zhilinae]
MAAESTTHSGFNPERFPEHAREWAQILEALGRDVARVIPDREEAFLALGADIQAFSSKSKAMAKQASALTELTAGQEIVQIVETLGGELDQINAVCGLSCRRDDLHRLEQVVELIGSLERRTGSFRKIVRTLQMLGVTTRIESARLGEKGRGFMNLAGQVDSLGRNIIDHWAKIQADAKHLGEQVSSALVRTDTLVREQQAVTEEALSSGQANLATLGRLSEHSADASRTLSRRTGEVSRHVGSIVASLQFHDITRQQVEHVCEAVEDMVRMLGEEAENGTSEADHQRMQETACWIADVCSLQASQLSHCSKAFEQAIDTLIADLSSIAETVNGLNRDLGGMLRSEGDSSRNVLDQIGANVHHLIDFMRGFGAKSEELGAIMVRVAETVAQMAGFVGNIEEVGSEIELIALNASVQAAHTGDEGLALGVLAGAIQRLSMDARTVTDEVAGELRAIADHALELQKLSDVSADARRMEQMMGRLEEMINSLRNLNRQTMDMFDGIRADGDVLCQDLQAQIEGITFHHDVLQDLTRARGTFEQLADQALVQSSADCDPSRRPERLKELLARYTMEAERMVHLGGEHGEAAAAESDDVELFGDDDGVELFGDDDAVELFGDNYVELFESDDGVELFDDLESESKDDKRRKEDFGDNVELF